MSNEFDPKKIFERPTAGGDVRAFTQHQLGAFASQCNLPELELTTNKKTTTAEYTEGGTKRIVTWDLLGRIVRDERKSLIAGSHDHTATLFSFTRAGLLGREVELTIDISGNEEVLETRTYTYPRWPDSQDFEVEIRDSNNEFVGMPGIDVEFV